MSRMIDNFDDFDSNDLFYYNDPGLADPDDDDYDDEDDEWDFEDDSNFIPAESEDDEQHYEDFDEDYDD